jgi:looped-hinge helix DNA binding domain, AbrB family
MRITSKGQVTIPQHIRELAGLKPHDEVEFEYIDGQVILRRVGEGMSRGQRLVAKLRGSATANLGVSADEWLRMTRGED